MFDLYCILFDFQHISVQFAYIVYRPKLKISSAL